MEFVLEVFYVLFIEEGSATVWLVDGLGTVVVEFVCVVFNIDVLVLA